jgi:hypothetical protein
MGEIFLIMPRGDMEQGSHALKLEVLSKKMYLNYLLRPFF